MKTLNLLITFVILILGLPSCAHKSGHTKQNPIQGIVVENSNLSKQNTNVKECSQQNLNVSISNNRGDKNRLDGSKIFSRYNTAVFMVYTSDGHNGYQGSAFFINNSGLAVSNYHVFQGTNKGKERIKLAGIDEIYNVSEVIHYNDEEDFILFRVNVSNTNFIPLAKNKPQVGEKVFAIGSPRGLENTFSSGEVSQWRDTYLMQISALIDHGSSGGALINEYGEVVGITSGSFADGSQANLNYAWSIDVIKPYVQCR